MRRSSPAVNDTSIVGCERIRVKLLFLSKSEKNWRMKPWQHHRQQRSQDCSTFASWFWHSRYWGLEWLTVSEIKVENLLAGLDVNDTGHTVRVGREQLVRLRRDKIDWSGTEALDPRKHRAQRVTHVTEPCTESQLNHNTLPVTIHWGSTSTRMNWTKFLYLSSISIYLVPRAWSFHRPTPTRVDYRKSGKQSTRPHCCDRATSR